MVKISSIFVAFLENMNIIQSSLLWSLVLQHVQREGEMRQKQKDPNMIGPFSCLLQVPSDALNNGDGAGVSLMSLRLGFCEKFSQFSQILLGENETNKS